MNKYILLIALLFAPLSFAASDDVRVFDIAVKASNPISTMTGFVSNQTHNKMDTIFVRFKIYNNGVVVENVIAMVESLDSKEVGSFSIKITKKFDSYKLDRINYY